MWDLIVSVPDHCLSFYFDHVECQKYPKFYYGIVCIFIFGNFRQKYFHWLGWLNFHECLNSGTLIRSRAAMCRLLHTL